MTAPAVRWMFARRLAAYSAARITRALNDAGIPCPPAADPHRNPHRTGPRWTLRTVAAILANPRYTGRQVRNRQRTGLDLVDPGNTGLGHTQVQRWNLPEGWVISKQPAHPALVSEADFIAAQDTAVPRGPAGPAARRYLLAGLLACGRCGRKLESAWSNGKPAHRCRHGGGPPLPWTVTTLGSLGTGGTPMVTKYQKFGDGYKAEAVKLYRESNQTIAETARNLGLKESTLANWVKKDRDNEAVAVGEAPLTPAERTRIRELEADVRRLNMENAFLKKGVPRAREAA